MFAMIKKNKYHILKNSENYRILNGNMVQQILKEAAESGK